MVRDNPNKIPQVREYYKKTSWDFAMHMRSEHTFESGVDKILQSPDKHDALARWLKAKARKERAKGCETRPYGGKCKWRTPFAPVPTHPGAQERVPLVATGLLQVRRQVQVRPRTGPPNTAAASAAANADSSDRPRRPGDTCHSKPGPAVFHHFPPLLTRVRPRALTRAGSRHRSSNPSLFTVPCT